MQITKTFMKNNLNQTNVLVCGRVGTKLYRLCPLLESCIVTSSSFAFKDTCTKTLKNYLWGILI